MQVRKTLKFVAFIGLLCLLLQLPSIQAQGTVNRLAVQTTNGQVSVYTLNSTGEVTSLEAANQTINSAIAELEPAALQSPLDIAIAPDGSQIALMVYSVDGSNLADLLVYSFEDNSLASIPLPGYGTLQWSPASNVVLLSPPSFDSFDLFNVLGDIYIYDPSQASLQQITNNPSEAPEQNTLWIPGSNTIVFSSGFQPCQTSCIGAVQNLFAIQTDGSDLRQLTDLDASLPIEAVPYSACLPQKLAWDAEASRVVYVVSCDDTDRELLFSVSLLGDNRLDLNLPALFPNSPDVIYSHLEIAGFHINSANNQIIVVSSVERIRLTVRR